MVCSQALFFGIGWVFFMNKLFKDYEVRNNTVRLVFAATFALSCTLFELIIFEIVDLFDRKWVFYYSYIGFVLVLRI